MTMPSERRRALRWARAVLEEVRNDPGLPAELRSDIASVLADFPDDRAVATCFLEEDDSRIRAHLEAIEAAHGALSWAKCHPLLTDQTRNSAAVTHRHFPQPLEMSKSAFPMPPRDWVEFYLLRDLEPGSTQRELLELGVANTHLLCDRLAEAT